MQLLDPAVHRGGGGRSQRAVAAIVQKATLAGVGAATNRNASSFLATLLPLWPRTALGPGHCGLAGRVGCAGGTLFGARCARRRPRSAERWRGSIRADRAQVDVLGGWLLGSQDVIGLNTFELLTRHPVRPEPARKGLVLRGTADPGALIHVSSDRGDFSFRIDALSTASDLVFLNGLARVSGSSSAERLTDDTRYDDYPVRGCLRERRFLVGLAVLQRRS